MVIAQTFRHATRRRGVMSMGSLSCACGSSGYEEVLGDGSRDGLLCGCRRLVADTVMRPERGRSA
eukprot:12675137-Heterocapsa_arctica.AAC.1